MGRARRRVAVGALLAASACGGCFVLDDMLLRAMLYPAPPVPVGPPPAGLEEVVLQLADATEVVAWASPARGRGAALLFLHGNGENLQTLARSGLFAQLTALGVDVLAVDYPGYGRSRGRPSEAALVEAAAVAFDRLADRYPGQPRAIFGWSLGAAVAVQVAARRGDDVERLAVASPWDSLRALASIHFGRLLAGWATRGVYDSRTAAAAVGCPVLWLHGEADRIIPVDHGRRLAAAFPASVARSTFSGVGHNDLLAEPEVWRALARFLAPEARASALSPGPRER